MPVSLTLSGVPVRFAVTLTTTPQRLKDIIGKNQLPRNRVPLGGKIFALSGDIFWGESSAHCDIPHAAADGNWDEPIAPIENLYFAGDGGSVTCTVVFYYA